MNAPVVADHDPVDPSGREGTTIKLDRHLGESPHAYRTCSFGSSHHFVRREDAEFASKRFDAGVNYPDRSARARLEPQPCGERGSTPKRLSHASRTHARRAPQLVRYRLVGARSRRRSRSWIDLCTAAEKAGRWRVIPSLRRQSRCTGIREKRPVSWAFQGRSVDAETVRNDVLADGEDSNSRYPMGSKLDADRQGGGKSQRQGRSRKCLI
jgi:hypothetical protein